MDLLALLRNAADVSARGQLRRLIPSAALVFLVAGLFAAGAPQAPPRFASAVKWAQGVKGVQLGLLILAVASASVFLQPLLGFLAGALQGSRVFLPPPISAVLIRRRAWQRDREEDRWQELARSVAHEGASATTARLAELRTIDQRLRRSPSREHLGPTRLSGILNAADEQVAARYGLDAAIVIPRLRVLAPERTVAAFDESLDDLRFATDLTSALLLGVIASIALLALHPGYLWLPALILALAWVSYRNALTAAAQFTEAQLVLFDLHRFVLYDTLQRPRPPNPNEERTVGRKLTSRLWRGDDTDEPYVPPTA
jgi:hypothetical protein